jgi:hypothetical protein
VDTIAINPTINPPAYSEANIANIELVKKYIATTLPQPATELKSGDIVLTHEAQVEQRVSLAGSLTWVNGEPAREIEWDSKSINNRCYAFFNRHLGSQITPDEQDVDRYLDMANTVIMSRIGIFKAFYNPRQSLLDYPDNQ